MGSHPSTNKAHNCLTSAIVELGILPWCQPCFTFVDPLLPVDDFSVKLVKLNLHPLVHLWDGDPQMLLDVRQELDVVVPDAAASLGQLSVVAVAAAGLAPLAMVPDLEENNRIVCGCMCTDQAALGMEAWSDHGEEAIDEIVPTQAAFDRPAR